MSHTYLVGYDGSDASKAAMRCASQLALATEARVVAAHVLSEQLGPDAWARARARAQALLAPLEAAEHRVVEGPAPHGLHDLAVSTEAALLFVGATDRGTFGRMVPGSVGERLIHAAPCPLVVVPSSADAGIATVGVAFDHREASRAALEQAIMIAEEQHAHLVLLTVAEAPAHPHLPAHGDERPAAVDVDAIVADAVERVGTRTPFGHRILAGPAGPALVGACADEIDLLVVGSRGYGPLHGVLAGSVSRHLVDHAPCPVLVVPRAHEPRRHRLQRGAAQTSAA